MAVSWLFVKLCIGQNVGQSPDFREGFDVAVARAVAELRILGLFSVYYLTLYQFIYSNMRLLFSRVIFETSISFLNLAEYCIPLVRVGGLFVAAKGNDPQVKFLNLLALLNVT